MKLLIDTDVGTDDASALILALSHPKVETLAITTVFGNVPLSQAVANASRIRRLLRQENVSFSIAVRPGQKFDIIFST